MKIQTPQFVIPAKAGTQEKAEKKRPISYKLEKIVLFQTSDWVSAFARMMNWGNASAYIMSNSRYVRGL
ncbi:MAG: hypothetical protein KBD76_15225 [Bacteriovorax sp.]|nr:hypothetical protein [Bacteriovorax sp.]